MQSGWRASNARPTSSHRSVIRTSRRSTGFEDAGEVRGLAMELLEGPTLVDRIARGAEPGLSHTSGSRVAPMRSTADGPFEVLDASVHVRFGPLTRSDNTKYFRCSEKGGIGGTVLGRTTPKRGRDVAIKTLPL